MPNARDKRRQRKMADAQLMQMLLQIQDMTGPKKQLEQDLLQEQLQTAQAQRGAFERMSPLEAQFQQQRIAALQSENEWNKELRPAQLEDQRSVTWNRDIAGQFDQRSMPIRLQGLQGQVKGQQLQNQQAETLLPFLKERANLDNQGVYNQNRMFPLQQQGAQLQNKAAQQQIDQGSEMFPMQKNMSTLNMAEMLQRIGVGQQASQMTDKDGKPLGPPPMFNVPQFMQQQGMNVGPLMAPNANNQPAPDMQDLDKMLGGGMQPFDQGQTPEMQAYNKQLPQLMQAMQSAPTYPWSQQSQAYAEFNKNPMQYGVSEPRFDLLAPENYQKALQTVQQRGGGAQQLPFQMPAPGSAASGPGFWDKGLDYYKDQLKTNPATWWTRYMMK